jgi:hypothetical protein
MARLRHAGTDGDDRVDEDPDLDGVDEDDDGQDAEDGSNQIAVLSLREGYDPLDLACQLLDVFPVWSRFPGASQSDQQVSGNAE